MRGVVPRRRKRETSAEIPSEREIKQARTRGLVRNHFSFSWHTDRQTETEAHTECLTEKEKDTETETETDRGANTDRGTSRGTDRNRSSATHLTIFDAVRPPQAQAPPPPHSPHPRMLHSF
eukprot:221328-Rhodomonas_salina.2